MNYIASFILVIIIIYQIVVFHRKRIRKQKHINLPYKVWKQKNAVFYSFMVGLSLFFICIVSAPNEKISTHYITKYIGKTALVKQQKIHKKLLAQAESLDKNSEDFSNEKSEYISSSSAKESSQKAESQRIASEKESSLKAASVQASISSAQQASSENINQNSNAETATDTQNTDMNTGETQQIVGNTRSHIYHVPGQAGYNMNSANAIYFQTEQEAINAGYRKSKR